MRTYTFSIRLQAGKMPYRNYVVRDLPLLRAPTPPIKVYLPEPKDQTEDPVLITWAGVLLGCSGASTGAAGKPIGPALRETGLLGTTRTPGVPASFRPQWL